MSCRTKPHKQSVPQTHEAVALLLDDDLHNPLLACTSAPRGNGRSPWAPVQVKPEADFCARDTRTKADHPTMAKPPLVQLSAHGPNPEFRRSWSEFPCLSCSHRRRVAYLARAGPSASIQPVSRVRAIRLDRGSSRPRHTGGGRWACPRGVWAKAARTSL